MGDWGDENAMQTETLQCSKRQNDESGGDVPRRRRILDDNNENEAGNLPRRRNRDDQSNNDGVDAPRRRNRDDQSNNDGGDAPRRRNRDDQSNNDGGDAPRRRNRDDQSNNDGGDAPRRRNRDDQSNNDGDQQRGGEGNRRRRRDETNESAPEKTGENGEAPKENYIPRQYNKADEDLFETVGEGLNFEKFDNIPVQVSGENIPDPIRKFSDIAKDPTVIEAIKKSGYRTLTPIQKYGISIVMHKRDLMASAQTGSGKTMAFLLPIVENLLNDPASKDYGDKCSPQALVLTPTRELAIQIYEQALKLTFKNDLKPCVVYGGTAFRDQKNRVEYGANIIVATPGRMLHFLEKEVISLSKLKYFVLDEADRMIDQGFIPCVRRVVNEFDIKEDRHTMMFSATFQAEIQRLAQEFLKKDYIFLSCGILGSANSDVKQEIRQVEFNKKRDELVDILKDIYGPNERILVFCEKKKMADFLASRLCDRDFKTTSIHGDRLQSQREQALNSFKTGETPILVATSVAARGLDIKGVNYVINYDLPKEIDEYVHRIGRTGRVGNSGTAISFFNDRDDSPIASKLAKLLAEANQNVPSWLASFDDGMTFAVDADKDTRHGNDDNVSERRDQYEANQPAAVEEDDW